MAWYNTSIFGGEPDEFQKQLNARAAAAEARATAPDSNRNRTISAINNFLPNLEKSVFGTERPQAIPTAAEPPSTPSPYTTEERGRRANARYAQDTKQMASFTPNERVGLAMRRGDMGEPLFDSSSIAAGGYDRLPVNTYDPQKAVGLPGMNPATGVGGSAIGAALQAAAARGDWDAVNRYYAGKGENFAGMAAPGSNALYDMAFGSGVRGIKKRDRAADLMRAQLASQTQLGTAGMQTAESRYRSDILSRAEDNRSKENALKTGILFGTKQDATRQAALKNLQAQLASQGGTAWLMKQPKEVQDSMMSLFLPPDITGTYEQQLAADEQEFGKADGGLITNYADGGPVIPPNQNPMGTFGQPPVMQSLDPAVREYGQYVHAATMNGLQPVPFGKFINLLATARQQMQTLPTTGGQYGFADGGMVSWLQGLFSPQQQPQAPTQTPQQRLGQGAAMLGGGMAGQAAQAIQGRNAALEEALGAARGARTGYAGGGAIPVAGRQVLGPGGPRDDAIPAVIDGTQPAGLSNGEFVMPTDVTQYWGTAKLQQMIDKARSQ